MARLFRSAGMLRVATIGAASVLAACVHQPPAPEEPHTWLDAAPAQVRIVDGVEKRCRKRTEIGTRIPVVRCLSREEEFREARRAATLLGLVGGGDFRERG